jgi:hypothetical protein
MSSDCTGPTGGCASELLLLFTIPEWRADVPLEIAVNGGTDTRIFELVVSPDDGSSGEIHF